MAEGDFKNRRTEEPNGPSFRKDALASLVVFLVALPLCMAIALASGAPMAAGLVTGIVGGLVVGLFAGAPLQVSGPAAGLTILCGEIIRQHGLPALGIVVMIAGGLQLAAGLARLGQWFRAVSPAVIHGMLSGIGMLIVASQIHIMVDDRPRASGLANLLSIPEALGKGLPLPVWEPADRRRARIELLRQFGDLHERQTEVTDHATRLVSRHARPAELAAEAKQLESFVAEQQRLVTAIVELKRQLLSGPLLGSPTAGAAQIQAGVSGAELKLAAALADLKADRPLDVPASQAAASKALAEVLASLKSHDWAAKVGLLSIAIIILWQGLAPRRLRLVPAPLLAVALTTGLAYALSLPVLYVETPANLIDGLTFPTLLVFQDVPLRELVVAGLTMAAVASAETLLCAAAVDRMHGGPRTQYDKELAAQGIGNLLCGLVGALPMTGVIVRSAANVQAGATSRWSSVLHGLWILLFVVFLGALLRMIPIAALAGILVYTGCKLIDVKGFQRLWKVSRSEALIFLITVGTIVATDLLTGVVTGVVLSAAKLLLAFSRLKLDLVVSDEAAPQVAMLRLAGAATFLRLPKLAAKLDDVPPQSHVQIHCDRLSYIDHACLELLTHWAQQHEAGGGRVVADWELLRSRFIGSRPPAAQLGAEVEPRQVSAA